MAGFCTPLHEPQPQPIKSEDRDHAASDRTFSCPACLQGAEHKPTANRFQPIIASKLFSPLPSGRDADPRRIFVWSLEDILILESAISGKFIQISGKEIAQARICLQKVEEHVVGAANTHFFYQEVEECDQAHIDDVTGHESEQELSGYKFFTNNANSEQGLPIAGSAWGLETAARRPAIQTTSGDHKGLEGMQTLALRYRHIKEIYEAENGNALHLLGGTNAEVWTRLCGEVDRLTCGWTNRLRHILQVISARPSCRNVLISSSPLLLTFTKLLLHGLGTVFPMENVYAANKIGRENCFERISARFGRKPVCIVIGSTEEQRNLALQLNWPYWDISLETDLLTLANALELGFL